MLKRIQLLAEGTILYPSKIINREERFIVYEIAFRRVPHCLKAIDIIYRRCVSAMQREWKEKTLSTRLEGLSRINYFISKIEHLLHFLGEKKLKEEIKNFVEQEASKKIGRQTFQKKKQMKFAASTLNQPIVITLHGIRTRGNWQKVLTPDLNEAGFIHIPLDYGFFRAVKVILPWKRDSQVKWFREKYTEVKNKYPHHANPSIIAHSFGTYLTAKAMELYGEVVFDKIIFCGSIVPVDYQWTDRFSRGQVNSVLNECGKKDNVVKLAGWAIKDAGPSGTDGFNSKIEECLHQRHNHGFRHSDYLYSLNYRNNWVPFLKSGQCPDDHPQQSTSINWRFWLVIIVFALLIITVIYVLFSKYRSLLNI